MPQSASEHPGGKKTWGGPASSCEAAWAAEADRQRQLLALVRGSASGMVVGLDGSAALQQRGLAVYRANAGALAERALAAAFPTVAQLMGASSFATLARAHWHHHPPRCGDLAWWGEGLPQAMAQDAQLSREAYLPDVARLDWAVHRAGFAADDEQPAQGLERLGTCDPRQLRLCLREGSAVVESSYPIVEIWRAHQPACPPSAGTSESEDRLAAACRALDEGRAQSAWVTRGGGLSARVLPLPDAAHARFTQSLLVGASLEQALEQAGGSFSFEAWLIQALRQNALASVVRVTEASG
jgi:Putative DNA-binding domain